MASSKSKKPPAMRQRRQPPELDRLVSYDQSLFIAFKKLKMDAEGTCIKKVEDESTTDLKHKADAKDTKAEDEGLTEKQKETPDHPDTKQQADHKEDWSLSLQNFCFCEEGAANKKGRPRWRSMCRYHRLRLKKDVKGKGSKSSSSLVQAWHAHKPVLRESKLKLADNTKAQFTMRAARFNFKPSSQGGICFNFVKPSDASLGFKSAGNGIHVFGSCSALVKKQDPSSVNTDRKTEKPDPSKPSEPTQEEATAASPQPVFAAEASHNLLTFSSVSPQPSSGSSPPSSNDSVPAFEGHRMNQPRIRRPLALWSQDAARQTPPDCPSRGEGGGASVGTLPVRLDLPVERSCSQEARLDESEFNVNELAAYFDNFLYMPKEMSSMAQMMYT